MKFLRTPFLQITSGRLLLIRFSIKHMILGFTYGLLMFSLLKIFYLRTLSSMQMHEYINSVNIHLPKLSLKDFGSNSNCIFHIMNFAKSQDTPKVVEDLRKEKTTIIWVKVYKNGTSKISRRQSLKISKCSNFLMAVFHKFY